MQTPESTNDTVIGATLDGKTITLGDYRRDLMARCLHHHVAGQLTANAPAARGHKIRGTLFAEYQRRQRS